MSLEEWTEYLLKSCSSRLKQSDELRKKLGDPDIAIISKDDPEYVIGFWHLEDGVITFPIYKGRICVQQDELFTQEYIKALVDCLTKPVRRIVCVH
jgi:hypothetical protein